MENRKLSDQPDAGAILASDHIYVARSGADPASLKGRIANLPLSTATQAALDGKQPLDSDLSAIAALSTTAFGRALLTLADAAAVKSELALSNVDNTADAAKPVSTATQTALDGKQPLDSDLTAIAALSTTGYGRGFLALADATAAKSALSLAKGDVGLGNVDNTADAAKPVSAAAQTALDAKQPLDSDLTAIAALSTTSYGRGLLTLADAAAVKASLAITSSNVGDFSTAADARIAAQKGVAGGVATLGLGGKVPSSQLVFAPPNVPQRNYVLEAAWHADTAPGGDCRDVAWSPQLGLFANVNRNGTIVNTSPDGINWTSQTIAMGQWNGICWAAEIGLFVAVDNNPTPNTSWVATSPDGITWTKQTTPSTLAVSFVTWSPERHLLVITGAGGQIYTSPDGIAWTARTSGTTNAISRCIWAPELGLFVASITAASGQDVITSPDGVTWTLQTTPARNVQGMAWSPQLGLLAATCASGTLSRVITSPDGINWTARTTPVDANWRNLAWSPELGLFLTVGSQLSFATQGMASSDGIVWTSIASKLTAAVNNCNNTIWCAELGIFMTTPQGGGTGNPLSSISSKSYPFRS